MTLHNALTGVELHETKGAAGATRGHILVASGAGTAVYQALLGNVVYVNTLADLPTAAGGKITLLASTTYLFGANINIGTDFLQFSTGSSVQSRAAFTAIITYTGTTPMLQGTDVNVTVNDINIVCSNSDVFGLNDTGGGGNSIALVSNFVILACKGVGTIDNLNAMVFTNVTAIDCTSGMTITGTNWSALRMTSVNFQSTSTTFIGMDFTGSVQKALVLDAMIFTGGTGSIGIKGDAANANISANFIAAVTDTQFTGVTTPLSGITTDDFRWDFQGNGVVADSNADAMVSLTANATVTTLAVGVPALIAGTWVVERESMFTGTTGGRITYNGERDLTTPIDITITLNPVSGTNKVFRAYLALNGAVIVNSGKAIRLDNADPLAITVPWQLKLTTGDFLEVFVENETDSIDVTVIDGVMRAR